MWRRVLGGLAAVSLLVGCAPSHDAASHHLGAGSPITAGAHATPVSGGIPWAPPSLPSKPGVWSCGAAYIVQAPARTMYLGSCSGLLPKGLFKPAVLKVGAVFYVRISSEQDGSLDYPVPAASSGAIVRIARQGPIVQYRAVRAGSVYLVAHGTEFCEGIDPKRGSCRILQIVVKKA